MASEYTPNNFSQNTSTNTHRYTRNDIRTAENDFNPQSSNDNSKLMTSTNIFIYSNGCIVGMIQSFSVSENRQINKLQAIGWEGVVQAVPSNTNGGQLSVSRIALYESNLWNALGLTTHGVPFNKLGSRVYDNANADDKESWDAPNIQSATDGVATSSRLVFKTLKDQRVPLEIQTKTRMKGSEEAYYTETYIDCWISTYSRSYSVGTITVAEQATIQYADVY